MKTLFVFLFALLLSFFFACQENNITDPVRDNDLNNQAGKDYISYINTDVIEIDVFVKDPVHRTAADIVGEVPFQHTLFKYDPQAVQRYIMLKVSINTDIYVNCHNNEINWKMNNYFEDVIKYDDNNETEIILEKRFAVSNACCHPCDLLIKFHVTEKTMKIESILLQMNDSKRHNHQL